MKQSALRSSIKHFSRNLVAPAGHATRLSASGKHQQSSGIQLAQFRSHPAGEGQDDGGRALSEHDVAAGAGNPREYQLLSRVVYGIVLVNSPAGGRFLELLAELKRKNPPLQRQDSFRERSPPEKSARAALLSSNQVRFNLQEQSRSSSFRNSSTKSPRLSLRKLSIMPVKHSMREAAQRSTGFQQAKTPRLRSRFSSLDSSFDSEDSENSEEEGDEGEADEEVHLEANVSYEFTRFMEDPRITEGRSKHTMLLLPQASFAHLPVQRSLQPKRTTDFIKIVTEAQQDAAFFGLSDEGKSQDLESGLELVHENLREGLDGLVKSFVISLSEAETLKLYRIRKANVQSNAHDFLADAQDDYNFADFFFDEESSTLQKEQGDKEKRQLQRRRKKRILVWFSCAATALALICGLVLFVLLLNPLGARDYCLSLLSAFYYGVYEAVSGTKA